MAKKITRIKASDGPATKKTEPEKAPVKKVEAKKTEAKKAKEKKTEEKKVFILFRPFVAFGRYIRDAFLELRQVRWPSMKDTWKMVLAVFVYTALFIAIISLLDIFFSWLFKLILGN